MKIRRNFIIPAGIFFMKPYIAYKLTRLFNFTNLPFYVLVLLRISPQSIRDSVAIIQIRHYEIIEWKKPLSCTYYLFNYLLTDRSPKKINIRKQTNKHEFCSKQYIFLHCRINICWFGIFVFSLYEKTSQLRHFSNKQFKRVNLDLFSFFSKLQTTDVLASSFFTFPHTNSTISISSRYYGDSRSMV